MTEMQRCPVDYANYFSGDDPEVARTSGGLAETLNQSVANDDLYTILRNAFNQAVAVLPDNVGLATKRFLAASVVRGSAATAVSHRQAMNLAPLTSRLLEGDLSPLESAVNDPAFQSVASADARVGTDPHFNRVWYGDDARLIVMTGLLLQKSVHDTSRQVPSTLVYALEETSEWATRCAQDLAEERERKKSGQQGVKEFEELLHERAFIADRQRRENWLTEHVFNLAGQGQSGARQYALPDTGRGRVRPFLSHQAEASSEHVAALVTDILHGIMWTDGEVDTHGLLRSIVARLSMFSASAFLPNDLLAKAEYDGRYVRADSEKEGRYGARREPMVLARKILDLYDIAPNPKSKYKTAKRAKRNRCPGPNPIPPRQKDTLRDGHLRHSLKGAIVGCYDSKTLRTLDRHFTVIDQIGVLSTIAAGYLIETGRATFDPRDMRRYLGYPEQATSNGIKALKKSLVRDEPQII